MYTKRELLLAMSTIYNGNYDEIKTNLSNKNLPDEDKVKEIVKNTKANYLTIADEDYPQMLKKIIKPPYVLYYYGNISLLEKQYRLTTIGSRTSTPYQLKKSAKLIEDCEEYFSNNLVIASGMSIGMEQNCLKTAMNKKAPIIVVLSSGIDKPYPNENIGIYKYCKDGHGLVISEYPKEVNCDKQSPLIANRIKVALSEILYVGSGMLRSGTSAAIRIALDYSVEIVALPCNEEQPTIVNAIIKDGADSILSSLDLVNCIEGRYSLLEKNS